MGQVDSPVAHVVLLLLLLLTACSHDDESPDARIRSMVTKIENAVEAGSVQDIADLLHPDYADSRHRSRRDALASLFAYTRQHRHIHLFTVFKSIDVSEPADTAEVVVIVAMTGVPVQSLEAAISVKADLYQFDLHFAEYEGEWLPYNAKWRRAASDGL